MSIDVDIRQAERVGDIVKVLRLQVLAGITTTSEVHGPLMLGDAKCPCGIHLDQSTCALCFVCCEMNCDEGAGCDWSEYKDGELTRKKWHDLG